MRGIPISISIRVSCPAGAHFMAVTSNLRYVISHAVGGGNPITPMDTPRDFITGPVPVGFVPSYRADPICVHVARAQEVSIILEIAAVQAPETRRT